MGKIGNYVHLHLENYYKYGTKQEGAQVTDFNATLFETHHRQLRALIEKQKTPNLDKIAEEYNKKNEAAWKMFAALDKKRPEDTNILHHLLHQINSLWTDDFIDIIISGLSWSSAHDTFIFKPPKNFKSQYTDTAISGLPALRLAKADFHYIKTLINYIDKFLKYLEPMDGEAAAADRKYLNQKKEDLKEVQKVMEGVTNVQRKEGKIKAVLGKKQVFINNVFFEAQQKELNQRREKYVGAAEINKQIQSAMAEIFGNIVAQDATDIGIDAVKKAINEALSIGRKGSEAINVSKRNFINLSAEAIEENYIEATKYIASKEGSNGKFGYRFAELGTSRAQKRDVELTIEDKTYGISVKNTQFAKAFAKSQNQLLPPSTIHLQNSSLLLFLTGMEKDPSSAGLANLGTHYLNALSTHTEGFDANIQQDALNSLKLYILYSSLTGQGQLRNSAGSASILAIYDKASSKNTPIERIKLFDMSEILLILDNLNFEQGVQFIPAINSRFLLPNKKVESNKGVGAAVQKRLTNILLAARSCNISTSLYTAFLRDKT